MERNVQVITLHDVFDFIREILATDCDKEVKVAALQAMQGMTINQPVGMNAKVIGCSEDARRELARDRGAP